MLKRRLRTLRTWLAVPGWAMIAWKVLGEMSTFQFAVDLAAKVLPLIHRAFDWLVTPAGSTVLMLCGFAWLAVIILISPSKEVEEGVVLDDEDIKVLQLLSTRRRGLHAEKIAETLSITPQKALYHLDKLKRSSDAEITVPDLMGNHWYGVTSSGRETLVKRGLL